MDNHHSLPWLANIVYHVCQQSLPIQLQWYSNIVYYSLSQCTIDYNSCQVVVYHTLLVVVYHSLLVVVYHSLYVVVYHSLQVVIYQLEMKSAVKSSIGSWAVLTVDNSNFFTTKWITFDSKFCSNCFTSELSLCYFGRWQILR